MRRHLEGEVAHPDTCCLKQFCAEGSILPHRTVRGLTKERFPVSPVSAPAHGLEPPETCRQTQLKSAAQLRACADRWDGPEDGKRARILHHLGSPLSFPNRRSTLRARAPTLPHQAHLRAVLCPPARTKDEPSARLPQTPHPREGRLREAGSGPGVRLRLRKDRRRVLLGEHAASQAG